MVRANTSTDDTPTIHAIHDATHPTGGLSANASALEMAAPRKRAAASFAGW